MSSERHYYDQLQFRVWPDGTVQCKEDGPPLTHKSDDFFVVLAYDEDDALEKVEQRQAVPKRPLLQRLLAWVGISK